METKFLGLLVGPPWHLRGPGLGSANAGVAAATLRGSLSSSPPSFRRPGLPAALRLRGASG
eukprot:5284438-Alexandrium_andersonii.AAC.1